MLRKKLKINHESADKDGENSESSQELSKNPQTSNFFNQPIWKKLQELEFEMSQKLQEIDFYKDKNVGMVYNPLEYACEVHVNYMEKYLGSSSPKRYLYVRICGFSGSQMTIL